MAQGIQKQEENKKTLKRTNRILTKAENKTMLSFKKKKTKEKPVGI